MPLEPHSQTSSSHEKRCILFISLLVAYFGSYIHSALRIALPTIAKSLKMDAVLIAWVPLVFLITVTIFLLPFGRISDLYGRARIFKIGIVVFTLSVLACGCATSPVLFIIAQIGMGIGSAMTFNTSIAILIAAYPASERGKVLGLSVGSVYFGLSTGPVAGGFITDFLGWPYIFFVYLPFGVLAIALSARFLHDKKEDLLREQFDLFLLLKNKTFLFSSLASFLNYASTFSTTFLLSLYLQYIKGFSPKYAGVILVSQPIVQALFSPAAGRLSDRVEPRIVASAGMSLCACSLLLLCFLDYATPIALVVAALLLMGIGFALFSSPNTNAIMSSVDRQYFGFASSATSMMRTTGQMCSMALSMSLFALCLGNVAIAPHNHASLLQALKTGYVISAVLCVVGVCASLTRGRVRSA